MQEQWRMSGKWRAWLVATAIGLLTTTASIQTVQAEDKGLSLADLAGSYAGNGGGFLTMCFIGTSPPADAACDNPSSVAIQFNDADVLQSTVSPDGQFCVTVTTVDSPVDASKLPAFINNFIVGGSVTSYDPRTGRGAADFTFYNAADGVSCKRATVVNPRSAQPVAHGTEDTQFGEAPALHFNYVFTSFTGVAGNFGGSVLSGTLYIQHE
jgi:hypothetical protein